ncbi:hypothetical protein BH11MYX4_BH11MYX4_23810 [soil metagenome]
MLRLSLLLALACLSACAGTRETEERPAQSPPRSRVPDAPLPSSAFRSDEEIRAARDGGAPPRSRFETRRIGAAADEERRPRYHGATVDLDLKNADLADVFRLLADVGHVNIVVSGEVTGTVTLRLRHVPWDQALDVIARTKGLGLERDGNVLTVASTRKP